MGIGSSAGGLLLGTVMNRRPDLFKLVILEHPFLDVMNTMLNEKLPLTTQEYIEWGNPNDSTYFHYMLNYSPYDNIKAQHYPHILIYSGLMDRKVYYWEQLKMTAKLRTMKKDKNLLVLKTSETSGHEGFGSVEENVNDLIFRQALILHLFGIKR